MTLVESVSLLLGLIYASSLLYFGGKRWGAALISLMALAAVIVSSIWPLLVGTAIAAAVFALVHRRSPQLTQGEGRADEVRDAVSHFFALSLLIVGLQYVVYHALLLNGLGGHLTRPDVVDAFIPIAGGLELKAIVTLNLWDKHHPAAAVMLFTVMVSAIVCKRAFCGWACPLGLLGTQLYRLRKRFIPGDALPPAWLDWPLRMVKYLLFFVLLYLVVFGMPSQALPGYFGGNYHMISDAKMGAFFLSPSLLAGIIIVLVLAMAMWQQQSFCRYLCPYGAGLGLLSFLSPFKIRRSDEHCLKSKGFACDKCTRACPARIEVDNLITVRSDECQACMRCISACPKKEALTLSTRTGISLSAKGVAVILMLMMFAIPLIAAACGYWHSEVTDEMRAYLLPYLHQIGH